MPKSTKPPSTTTPRTTRQRTPPTSSATTIDFTHDEVAVRAYEIYLGDGAIDGRDVDHWLKAENELRDRLGANGR
jgi:hypothetical protein